MLKTQSNLDRLRSEQKQQVDARREAIITAAQQLFLEKGITEISMRDIAEGATINRATLYRYFPDRHPLTFEVAARMLEKIATVSSREVDENVGFEQATRTILMGMIHSFDELIDAYRYIGMFDQLYGRAYPTEELAKEYQEKIFEIFGRLASAPLDSIPSEKFAQLITVTNTIMSFLEKMAGRGELMGGEQGVPMQIQIEQFEQMINLIIDQFLFASREK
ncbi:MAG: TetR/AcrR family transcriptional regulator [Chloroflexota bacterium]